MASNTSDLSVLDAATPLVVSSDLVNLRDFYASEELSDCDLALAGGMVIPGHKLVLAGASPAFKTWFSSREATTVDLQRANPAAMQLLLEFMYGRDVSVPMTLIVEFYTLAFDFQVARAAAHVRSCISSIIGCPHVLAVLLHKAHSTGAATRGITVPLTRLAAAALPTVMQQEVFKRYPLQLLLAILRSPQPAHQQVASVLAAANWLAADYSNRLQHWERDILPVLPLEDLLPHEIEQIHVHYNHLFHLPGVGFALVTACLERLKQATAPAPTRRRVRARPAAVTLRLGAEGRPIQCPPDRVAAAGQQPV